MKTWNQETKDHFLQLAQFRLDNDLFEQGQWLNKDKQKDGVFCGCMHGCLIQKGEDVLKESAQIMQWPLWLTYLSEKIFEGLPSSDSSKFVVDLINAVPVDADISLVQNKVEIARMERLKTLHKGNTKLTDVLDQCIAVWDADEIAMSAERDALLKALTE